MSYTIKQMTKTESGTYNLSGDISADLFEGGKRPEAGVELECAMADKGYIIDRSGQFAGWGEVYWHYATGKLLSVQDC